MNGTKLGLRISKKKGEEVIKLLNQLLLFDRHSEILRNQACLYLPLIREPLPAELAEIRRLDPEGEIVERIFKLRPERQVSLAKLLEDTLEPHLLASLPHSADVIGDIVVIEAPPELEKYQKTIGEALLKVYRNAKTVLAKQGAVTGDYRIRNYRVIAGEERTSTFHKEYGCTYHVDLAKAYFSPRLSYEHNRVASQVGEGETVIDMFAGVGPFSVLIAKKHERVKTFAIDVNPDAVEFLKENARINRVEAKVVPVLGDARKVIESRLRGLADRVIMNLPEKGIEYVDAACQALKTEGGIVHFYGFTGPIDPIENVTERFQQSVSNYHRKLVRITHSGLVRATAPYEWQAVLDAQIV